jgi:alkylation response protein AidB-like acyl-CoA dehydrogenase
VQVHEVTLLSDLVDFELSDDQLALQDAARALLDDLASPVRVRAHIAAGAPYDERLWSAMVEQGWLGTDVPEADGGLGFGFVEVAVLMEQVGRHAAPAPFHQTALAAAALAGRPEAARLLEGAVACVGWRTVADAPALVPYAPIADIAVVASPSGVVVHDLTGDRPAAESAMDLTRCVGWIAADRPGEEIGGPAEAQALLDRGAVATSMETLGGSATVLDLAVEHAKERVQFGKPIGSFQAVKHRLADVLVDVEGMRSTAYHAAWAISAGDPEASVAASTAKAWCADAGRRVMASGLQVHGGIGFTWEHDLHLFLKRAQLDQVSFGDATFHRERLAVLLRERLEAGLSIV